MLKSHAIDLRNSVHTSLVITFGKNGSSNITNVICTFEEINVRREFAKNLTLATMAVAGLGDVE